MSNMTFWDADVPFFTPMLKLAFLKAKIDMYLPNVSKEAVFDGFRYGTDFNLAEKKFSNFGAYFLKAQCFHMKTVEAKFLEFFMRLVFLF